MPLPGGKHAISKARLVDKWWEIQATRVFDI